jgi:hypothetical protein
MSKTYLKSDHFIGGGSNHAMDDEIHKRTDDRIDLDAKPAAPADYASIIIDIQMSDYARNLRDTNHLFR